MWSIILYFRSYMYMFFLLWNLDFSIFITLFFIKKRYLLKPTKAVIFHEVVKVEN